MPIRSTCSNNFGDVDELGVTELSKRLKLHKNNVFRLLATLEARGYIEQNKATENYRLGIKCLHLGRRYIHHMGLVRQARPILADVARKCRESAFVAIARRDGVVPLEAAEPDDRAVRSLLRSEMTLPLHCTAIGKAHLAFDPEEQVKSILPEQMNRYTTADDRGSLDAARATPSGGARRLFDRFGRVLRGCGIGSGANSRLHASQWSGLSAIAGPAYRLPGERISHEIAPLMLDAGRELSYRLGYNE